MPPKEWLKPHSTLILFLFLLTLVSVSALGWFGWRLLDQERIVENERAQEALEQTADQAAGTLRGALAEAGERVGSWVTAPPAQAELRDGLLLQLTDASFSTTPAGRLLYDPVPSTELEAPPSTFAEGELLEFLQEQTADAAAWYRHTAQSPNPAIRAGALLRLARVLRNSGQPASSRAVYAQLAGVSGVRVAGVPPELAAREAQCELLTRRADAAALLDDLRNARWRLTRGQFEFYWAEASRLAGSVAPPPAEALALSAAATLIWTARRSDPAPRGQQTAWVEGRPFFFMWRGVPQARAVLITRPETILKQAAAADGISLAAMDAEGRLLAGRRETKGAAVRTAAENQLPWTLYVTRQRLTPGGGIVARQRFLIFGITLMVLFLLGCSYFIARAIRREAEAVRMQSDFVSAVSHEFRTPLTSIRQLSEILAFGRVPSEERRQVYYSTLVQETVRLQRLVEALLNFGRMEAGRRLYRLEQIETAALVERVVAEFAPQAESAGRRIELRGSKSGCRIDADSEAISVALRNLVDNALKYSPDCPTVWVEWALENGSVAVRVRDHGPGVADSEKKAIFRKFVRGSAAAAGKVKGSGVGLAVVRDIVAAHHGEVKVESAPGEGSTFTILLPAAAARLERV